MDDVDEVAYGRELAEESVEESADLGGIVHRANQRHVAVGATQGFRAQANMAAGGSY